MPQRYRLSLEAIAEWHNVTAAAYQAARGKRDRPEVQAFFNTFDRSVQFIQSCIAQGELADGDYRSFMIRDPKVRQIHAASFNDRVIHHAIINQMQLRFERSWVDSSYACRQLKGSHRAVVKASELSGQYAFVVKLDIKAYFASINHQILKRLISRQFKGFKALALVGRVLESFSQDRGLPIGALTSQYFANHYLDGFQRYLRDDPRVRDEIRYMDDVLVFTHTLKDAKDIASNAKQWLYEQRDLTLKPPIIQRTRIGVEFCGFKVSQSLLKMGRRRKRRYQSQLADLLQEAKKEEHNPLILQQRANQVKALCYPGNHQGWQLRELEKIDRHWFNYEL